MPMSRRRLMSLIVAAAALGRTSPARARDGLERLADPDNPDGVLGLAVIARDRSGEVAFEAAHGRSVTGAGDAGAFTLDTPVRVASISKMIATWGLMGLVGEGRIDLQADVSDYLDFPLRHPAYPRLPITATMLASHRAGLRNGQAFPVPLGRRLQEALAPGGVLYEDGDWWSSAEEPPFFFRYADVNVAVLAQAVERITGERFDRFMTRTVFEPLGLDVGYNWSGVSQAKRDRASACCAREDGRWIPQVDAAVAPAPRVWVFGDPERPGIGADDHEVGSNGFAFSPQGGLRASVRDLDALGRALRGGAGIMVDPVWTYDGTNGDTDAGRILRYGLNVQAAGGGDAGDFFGADSGRWRGHFGEAYGLVSGLFWNLDDSRSIAWAVNGTPREAEAARRQDPATLPWRRDLAITPWERSLIQAALHPG